MAIIFFNLLLISSKLVTITREQNFVIYYQIPEQFLGQTIHVQIVQNMSSDPCYINPCGPKVTKNTNIVVCNLAGS